MWYLVVVSFIWAFSFGLIKNQLVGLDPNFVAMTRMGLALLIFLPFLRPGEIRFDMTPRLILLGMVQYGVMYIAYLYAFQFLKAYEVALFTVFTPIYVTLLADFFRRRFIGLNLLAAAMAVAGAAIIIFDSRASLSVLAGFLVMQVSNFAFAFGQTWYTELMRNSDVDDQTVFGFIYLGAFLFTGAAAAATTAAKELVFTTEQIWTLLYLGILPTGLGFFLWNRGARLVSSGFLAVMNNLKIPLSIAVSIFVFGESGSLVKLLAGGLIILAAMIITEKERLFKKTT
ncbi:MAG TPA: EamA family transporter [Calditrichia bacterium]|nr:EamA family transporter [Calditrichia bacterium]